MYPAAVSVELPFSLLSDQQWIIACLPPENLSHSPPTLQSSKQKPNQFLLPVLCVCSLSEVRIWDVVNELVGLCTNPSPSNPFALDVRYVQNLPLPERFLVSGALLNFLETYVVHGNKDELHYDRGEALVEHRGVNSSAVLLPAGGASELRYNVQFVFLVIQCITQLK